MNATIIKFLNKQDINYENLKKLNDIHVDSSLDINSIIYNNRINKNNYVQREISIGDIKGYNYQFFNLDNYSCIENMSRFFDENGSGYEKRSLSMLDYTTENIIANLKNSFQREPITLNEADKGIYVISDNGMHRFHVIKAHYLKELALIDKDDKDAIKDLKDKYKIETRVNELDFLKTYCKYIIKLIAHYQHKSVELDAEYDEYWTLTGNSILKIYGTTSTKQVLNDNQLTAFLKNSIKSFLADKSISKKEYKQFFNSIKEAYTNFDSFKEFYDENLQQLTPYIKDLKDIYINEEEK